MSITDTCAFCYLGINTRLSTSSGGIKGGMGHVISVPPPHLPPVRRKQWSKSAIFDKFWIFAPQKRILPPMPPPPNFWCRHCQLVVRKYRNFCRITRALSQFLLQVVFLPTRFIWQCGLHDITTSAGLFRILLRTSVGLVRILLRLCGLYGRNNGRPTHIISIGYHSR